MPIDAYGMLLPDKSPPQSVELKRFDRAPLEMRYEHLHNAIDLIWNEPRRRYAAERKQDYDPDKHDIFIWNEWTELMMRAYCEEREVIVAGPGACVAGHTRILDPITGECPTIGELHENRIAPVVMTTDGPEQADVPFVKGVDDLFEVVLDNGNRFTATAQHRVLTSNGYVHVRELARGSRLLGYAQAHQESNLGSGPSVRAQGVRGSQRRVEDSRGDCHPSRRCDDELPLQEAAAGRSFAPLLADALGCSRFSLRPGDQGGGVSHNLERLRFGHPSTLHFSGRQHHSVVQSEHREFSRTCGRIDDWFSQPLLSSLSSTPLPPVSVPVRDFASKHLRAAYQITIQEHAVVSITRTSHDIYYDITVPIAAHYFAEGAIHHNSYKTGCLAMYFLCFWLCSPYNTRVILTSTTGDGLRARVWKELTHFYRAVSNIGNLVQSRTMIQFVKGDDGAGIFGIAVESDGNVDKAVNKIVGRHNTNMGIGIDEMPTVSNAIVEARINLETAAERYQLGGIGNPDSHFDPHGKMAEPVDGWDSISVETETWRAKSGAFVIHLYGPNSPKVREPDKFPGLIGQADIDRTADRDGEDSPQMWKQRYGFWAPEGMVKTVLSETMITKFKAKEKAIWVSGYRKAAGLDPSFEGQDRCVLRIVKFGIIDGGKTAIEFYKTHIIKVRVGDPEPIHYQIVRQVKEICISEDIPPNLFGLDSTGEGGGLGAIFVTEWSPRIVMVEFGGRASDRPVSVVKPDSKETPKKGFEEYLNRVTELWYGFRVLVRNGQIRGLDDDTAIEFCKRYYELRGNMLVVETKTKMKERTGKSPDLADGAVVAAAVVQENDATFVGSKHNTRETEREWNELARKHDLAHSEDAYLVEAI